MISNHASSVSLNSFYYYFAGGGLCTYGNFIFICRFSRIDREIFVSSSHSVGPRVNGMQAFLSRLAEVVSQCCFQTGGSRCPMLEPAVAPLPRAAGEQSSCSWHVGGSCGGRTCPRSRVLCSAGRCDGELAVGPPCRLCLGAGQTRPSRRGMSPAAEEQLSPRGCPASVPGTGTRACRKQLTKCSVPTSARRCGGLCRCPPIPGWGIIF